MALGLPANLNWLPEEEEQTRSLLDALFHAFVSVDADGRITQWNMQAERIFAWQTSDVLGRCFSEMLVHPKDRPAYNHALHEFFSSNGTADDKLEITAVPNGQPEFPVELNCFAILHNGSKRMAAFVKERGAAQPVPEEVEIDERYRALMDQLAEPYSEVDLAGKFLFVNQSYRETFGSSNRAAGNSYKGLFSPEEAVTVRDLYHDVYVTGRPARLQFPRTLADGSRIFYEQSVSLKRNADGSPIGFSIISRNCTQRKQNEIAVAQAKADAEAATRTKAEFLSNMSHEIRTPLSGIIAALEVAGTTEFEPEQRELLGLAQGSARNLLAVINSILEFSRIEAGKLELDYTPFDLEQTIAQSLVEAMAMAREKHLDLSCDIEETLPHLLLGDPTRLRQVLKEIVSNAVKFTEQGRVVVRTFAAGGAALVGKHLKLTFSISDTGVGIPAEKQKPVFEAFSQADGSLTRKYDGTGLGLAICHALVKLMGGNLGVETEPGKGSTFYFSLVFGIDQREGEPAVRPIPEAGRPGGHRPERAMNCCAQVTNNSIPASLRILLADDSQISQRLTARILEKLGHRVVIASDGTEVLSILQRQSFDLVLMDIEMPTMNGLVTAATIRSRERGAGLRMPIIAMTAHTDEDVRELCRRAGIDDYVAKPVDGSELQEGIRRVLPTHGVQ